MGRKPPHDQHPAATLLADIADQLPDNGLDDRRRDARLLLAMALGRDDAVLPHEDITVTPKQHQALNTLIARRQQGEPISRMRGWREFYSLNFKMNPATLDPRADSEVVVDQVLAYLRHGDMPRPRLLDLGTGTGCLLLASLNNHPNAVGVGVDVQPDAVAMANQNAAYLGLSDRAEFFVSSWDSAIGDPWAAEGQFDVIISNPPYIPSHDLLTLMDEVKNYDPPLALDGGADGLEAWRALAPVMARRLRDDGAVFVEIGQGQDDAVTAIFKDGGLNLVAKYPDLSGVNRCLQFSKD